MSNDTFTHNAFGIILDGEDAGLLADLMLEKDQFDGFDATFGEVKKTSLYKELKARLCKEYGVNGRYFHILYTGDKKDQVEGSETGPNQWIFGIGLAYPGNAKHITPAFKKKGQHHSWVTQ